MNKADVLRVAGEPVGWYDSRGIIEWNAASLAGLSRKQPLYTEAQLLAAYAKGAEDMRERAKRTCAASKDAGDDRGIERDVLIWNKATTYCENAIRALPITPTNEGEQA